jgi:hypothetical protein
MGQPHHQPKEAGVSAACSSIGIARTDSKAGTCAIGTYPSDRERAVRIEHFCVAVARGDEESRGGGKSCQSRWELEPVGSKWSASVSPIIMNTLDIGFMKNHLVGMSGRLTRTPVSRSPLSRLRGIQPRDRHVSAALQSANFCCPMWIPNAILPSGDATGDNDT